MQKKKHRKGGIGKAAAIAAFAALVILVIYIMANGLGLVDGLDFGAGAYYYADIPNFSNYVSGDHYTSRTPLWAIILLFLAWGALMYKLWIWLDRKFQ